MNIKKNTNSVFDIFKDGKIVDKVYLGSSTVYVADDKFIFTVNIPTSNTEINLQNTLRGRPYGGLTDWGDGTRDASLKHMYTNAGVYTIRTRYSPGMRNNTTYYEGKYDYRLSYYLTNVTSLSNRVTDYSCLFYYMGNLSADTNIFRNSMMNAKIGRAHV